MYLLVANKTIFKKVLLKNVRANEIHAFYDNGITPANKQPSLIVE